MGFLHRQRATANKHKNKPKKTAILPHRKQQALTVSVPQFFHVLQTAYSAGFVLKIDVWNSP